MIQYINVTDNSVQHIQYNSRLPTIQAFTVVSKTVENGKLFSKSTFDNIPQLGLLVSS